MISDAFLTNIAHLCTHIRSRVLSDNINVAIEGRMELDYDKLQKRSEAISISHHVDRETQS